MNNTTHDTDTEHTLPPMQEVPPMPLPAADEPASVPAPLMDEQGAFTPGWFSRFEELQPYAASLSKFRRPEALAKSYASLERMKGYPDPADAPRMAAFRAAVGLPGDAAEFAITRPEDTPDEIWNDQLAGALSQVAYEYGVPPKAMEALAARYSEEGRRFVADCHRREGAAIAEADAALQQEWGGAYEANMDTIASFLSTMGERAGVDVRALVENPALRANPDFARLMLEAASLTQEAPLHTGNRPEGREEAHRIAHDPTHPLHEAYMRTNHPQHRYANEQYDRLAFGRSL
ncbi:MAG: hypothetical protein IKK45_00200 [Akkermansia sp.]|nr:hypothetical protein [Akkermansia sp.]